MNRANRILPVYSGDVSGACSALFELGGMVVIHDPSGCNSTYNTHDETRWYDHDSLIFISALRERDAILGNDDKLVRDVVDAALELQPRFIALTNSPIPFISGTDFAALTKLIEHKTNIPCFYVRSNGMHDYVVGAANALAAVAERFVTEHADKPVGAIPRLNLLGVTPLDFYGEGQLSPSDLRCFVGDAGFELASCW
ncbi:MAG: nitrogenase component 1, partial [Coriobacteriales bacterium]|nr:nitrogenase component 1 [Coriobacteriales bacterium]